MEHLTSLFSVKLQLCVLMLWCQVKEKKKRENILLNVSSILISE